MELHELSICPEPSCRMVAEIHDRFTLGSTDGPIEHVKTYCVNRHVVVLPTDHRWLVGDAAPRDARSPRTSSRTNRVVAP
jgi:hypothetical protein